MSDILGIDLGTTNSLVGIYEAGMPILLADSEGHRLTPSAVYFPESGAPITGRAALRQHALHPTRTLVSVKRLMGCRQGEDPGTLPMAAKVMPDGRIGVVIGDHALTPKFVSAEILKHLREIAEKSTGNTFSRAVITVPAYFNDAQRAATKRAGELAGLQVERILAEPTAAALAYGLGQLGQDATVAVFDLGGGTFDISILKLQGDIFEVVSTHGDTRLGGDDIDLAVAEFFAEQLHLHSADSSTQVRLLEAARTAKEALSDQETTTVRFPFLGKEGGTELEFSRTSLERLARPILEKTRRHCERALLDAGIDRASLQEIILVGGATRMPLVRSLVAEIFGRAPNLSQHPDEAVALGATIQAGILSGGLQGITLLDITPLSLGIETFGGLMNVIIPRNTTIPCKAGEMFTNVATNQTSMQITVLQGERELAEDNWKLGEFGIPFTPAPKGQARVGVQFEIDANGILHVLARDIASSQDTTAEILSAVEVSDEAVEMMLADSLENALEDMNARVLTEARLKAAEMLPAVRKALEKLAGEVPAEMRTEILAAVDEVSTADQAGEIHRLKRALATLDDITQPLATLLLEKTASKPGAR